MLKVGKLVWLPTVKVFSSAATFPQIAPSFVVGCWGCWHEPQTLASNPYLWSTCSVIWVRREMAAASVVRLRRWLKPLTLPARCSIWEAFSTGFPKLYGATWGWWGQGYHSEFGIASRVSRLEETCRGHKVVVIFWFPAETSAGCLECFQMSKVSKTSLHHTWESWPARGMTLKMNDGVRWQLRISLSARKNICPLCKDARMRKRS